MSDEEIFKLFSEFVFEKNKTILMGGRNTYAVMINNVINQNKELEKLKTEKEALVEVLKEVLEDINTCGFISFSEMRIKNALKQLGVDNDR